MNTASGGGAVSIAESVFAFYVGQCSVSRLALSPCWLLHRTGEAAGVGVVPPVPLLEECPGRNAKHSFELVAKGGLVIGRRIEEFLPGDTSTVTRVSLPAD
jgi:hypothetical protein